MVGDGTYNRSASGFNSPQKDGVTAPDPPIPREEQSKHKGPTHHKKNSHPRVHEQIQAVKPSSSNLARRIKKKKRNGDPEGDQEIKRGKLLPRQQTRKRTKISTGRLVSAVDQKRCVRQVKC